VLKNHPFERQVALASALGNEPIRLVGKVEQHGAGFEHRDRFAAGAVVVDDGGDLVVRVDGKVCGRLLFAFGEVDPVQCVRESELVEGDEELLAIGGRPSVRVDHAE
jgi:selenophosphate synthetase-related protein